MKNLDFQELIFSEKYNIEKIIKLINTYSDRINIDYTSQTNSFENFIVFNIFKQNDEVDLNKLIILPMYIKIIKKDNKYVTEIEYEVSDGQSLKTFSYFEEMYSFVENHFMFLETMTDLILKKS